MTLIWAPRIHGIQQVEPRSHFLADLRAVSAADAVPATVSVESWAIAARASAQSASAANALKKIERRRLAMQQGCVVSRTVVSGGLIAARAGRPGCVQRNNGKGPTLTSEAWARGRGAARRPSSEMTACSLV